MTTVTAVFQNQQVLAEAWH